MADSKITALAALTAADPVNDMFPVVDVSDTSMAASGTTKRISANNILSSSPTASGALTVTGLVTAGSATITGALTVDTSTLKVDATNNRVGINTATPGYPLEVVGNAVFSADATCKRFFVNDTTGSVSAYINSANGSQSIIYLGGQTNYANGSIIYDDASNFLAFKTNNAEAARFNSTANLVLKGGTVGATGVGVTFPAAQSASSDANCLDDYEEGTTSTITIATQTSGTITLNGSFNTISYTKIGRMVTVTGNLLVSSVSLPIGSYIDVNGLPFARNGSRNTDTSPSISVISAVSAGATTFYGYIPTSSTSTLRIIGDATQYQANTEIMISLQYFV